LKPSTILVDNAGRPKLLDFGIAKLVSEGGDVTQVAERVMTPNYASPDQVRGQPQTTATDIYSLGVVLYKLLTGVAPREQWTEHSKEDLPRPSRLNPDSPVDLDFVVAKALRTEPEERYATVDAFANDLR